ncbi:MAG: reprolysin-like metallopeptidase, partial [Candidatus Hodarchaeales archaeon]
MVSYRYKKFALTLMIIIQVILSILTIWGINMFVLRPSSVDGKQNVIVLCIYSNETVPQTSIGEIELIMDEVIEYYTECSYSQVSLSYEVVGWLKSNRPMSSYAVESTSGEVAHGGAFDTLVFDTIALGETLVDFSNYDRLVIVHAGHGKQEYTLGNSSHIGTCHMPGWYPTNDGRVFKGASIVSEFDDMTSFAHELGHDFGAVDLYDYESKRSSSTGISYWGIMNSGHEVHMCAYNKLKVGWIDKNDIFLLQEESCRVDLVPISCQTSGYRAIRYNLPDGRYYLIEARSSSGFDENLLDSGVLVMLVNESRLSERRDGVQLQIPTQSSWLSDASLREGETYYHLENSFAVRVVAWNENLVTVEASTSL